jgi:hypothetical protein
MANTIKHSRRSFKLVTFSVFALSLTLLCSPASAQQGLSTTLSKKAPTSKTKLEAAPPQNILLAVVDTRSRIQRVARLYLEIAADSRTETTIPMFTREVSLLDGNIAKLDKSQLSTEEAKVFNRIRTRYDELRALFLQPYSRENGELVYATSEELMASAQKLAQLSAQGIDTEAGYALDISSRVMAQTERIAKAFMQCALTQSRSSLVDLEQWRKEHATGLSQLAEMKINDGYTYYNLNLSVMLNKQQAQYVDVSLKAKRCTVPTSMLRSSDAMWSILQSTNTRYFNQMNKPIGIG